MLSRDLMTDLIWLYSSKIGGKMSLRGRHIFTLILLFLQPANILLDEHGHVRISDLGLACDFSKKKPHASV